MFCPICGMQNSDELKICTRCGNALDINCFSTQEKINTSPDNNPTKGFSDTSPKQNEPVVFSELYTEEITHDQQPQPQQQFTQSQNQQPQFNQPQFNQPQFNQPQHQQYSHPQFQQAYKQPIPENGADPGKIFGIVGMCLSLASFILSDSYILAIAGIVLSAIGIKKSKNAGFNNSFAKVGLIFGIINAALTIILLVAILILYFFLFSFSFGYSV